MTALYVASGFEELANDARIVAMTPGLNGIHEVLCHASGPFDRGELPTRLGAIVLLPPGENPEEGLEVFQVVPHTSGSTLPARLTTQAHPLTLGAMAAESDCLIVPNATPDETALAWAMYDAGRQLGAPTDEALLQLAADFLGPLGNFGDKKSPAGQSLQALASMARTLASRVPALERLYDTPAVERAKPIRLTIAPVPSSNA